MVLTLDGLIWYDGEIVKPVFSDGNFDVLTSTGKRNYLDYSRSELPHIISYMMCLPYEYFLTTSQQGLWIGSQILILLTPKY